MTQIICRRCVMDKSAKEIIFDENGVCNFCHIAQRELALAREQKKDLPKIVEKIKKAGRKKKYDVLIGLSGGVDSSFALYSAVQLGIRPLAYSIDNHWNTKESDENIMRLVETLKVPFYRYTIDQKKFLDVQSAFLKAGLINAEIPTDHILLASIYEMARNENIKWIISGGNAATESIMPLSWSYPARDLVHIKDVYRKMTHKELMGIPMCSLWQFNVYKWWHRIKMFYLLDYIEYDRAEAVKILQEKVGYRPYGEKHEESVFTQWFQSFYLFEKFGIDKRKAHFSALINSDQMTRKEALERLGECPVYPKMGIEQKVMAYPKRHHKEFATDIKMWTFLCSVIKILRKHGIIET